MRTISSKLMSLWLVAICPLFSALFFPISGFAEVAFNKTSPVPVSLQTYIESKIQDSCPDYNKTTFRLIEHKTFVRPVRIDGVVFDYFYTTIFRAYRGHNRDLTEFLGDVVVNSGIIAVASDDNHEVTRIDGPTVFKCKKSASK